MEEHSIEYSAHEEYLIYNSGIFQEYFITQLSDNLGTFHGIFLLMQLLTVILFHFLKNIPGIFFRLDRTQVLGNQDGRENNNDSYNSLK